MPIILLVEDHDALGEILIFQLNNAGFNVLHASCLNEAYKHLDGAQLILLDWILPDGEGLSLLPLARQMNLPVIMLTARASQGDRDLALEAGAQAFITKPYAFADLEACIRYLI